MVLRDVGSVLGLSYGHVDKICKMVPFDPSRPLHYWSQLIENLDLNKEIKNNPKVQKLIDLSLKLED